MYHIYDSLFETGFSTAWPSPHHCWLCEHGELPFCRRLLSSGCRIRRQKENPKKSEVENKSKTSSHFGSPLSYPPLFFLSSLNSISLLICPLLHFIIPQKVIQAGLHEGNSSPPKVSSSVFFHRVTSWSNDKGAHPGSWAVELGFLPLSLTTYFSSSSMVPSWAWPRSSVSVSSLPLAHNSLLFQLTLPGCCQQCPGAHSWEHCTLPLAGTQ